MLKNSEMKEGRILRLQRGRKIMRRMQEVWSEGGTVIISSHRKHVELSRKHSGMVKMGKSGSVYMQRGKNWDCIDFCNFHFFL